MTHARQKQANEDTADKKRMCRKGQTRKALQNFEDTNEDTVVLKMGENGESVSSKAVLRTPRNHHKC